MALRQRSYQASRTFENSVVNISTVGFCAIVPDLPGSLTEGRLLRDGEIQYLGAAVLATGTILLGRYFTVPGRLSPETRLRVASGIRCCHRESLERDRRDAVQV